MPSGVTFAKAVKAAITLSDAATANDTVQIGGIVYKFETSGDLAAAYDVLIATDATTQATALVAAINRSGTAGTDYYDTGTLAHPHVTATNSGGAITLTAKAAGDWAQAIALVDGLTAGTVGGASFDDITTGTDGSGSLSSWITGLRTGAQLNSDVLHELQALEDGS